MQPRTRLRSFIEHIYNVADYEALLTLKKQKTNNNDENDEKRKATFKGSKGRVISKYLKEQRDQGARKARTIDLTIDDEEDDLQIVSIKSTP